MSRPQFLPWIFPVRIRGIETIGVEAIGVEAIGVEAIGVEAIGVNISITRWSPTK